MKRINDKNYTTLCVWEGTIIDKDNKVPSETKINKFEKFIIDTFKCRSRFESVQITKPGNGGEGGRSDLFFYIHSDDVSKFAVPRLQYGIRWFDDSLSNGNAHLYSKSFLEDHKN